MNGLTKKLLVAGLLSVALARTASATTAEMKLVSGETTITIFDNGANDSALTTGVISYSNPNFNGWNVSVTSGVSNSPGISPIGIDLTATILTTGGNDTLDIFFSDLNFNAPISAFNTRYITTVLGDGSTNELAWADNSNTIFGLGASNLIGNAGPFSSPGGLDTKTGGPAAGGAPPYSLTLEQIIKSNSAGFFSTDGTITPTPEPSNMILFGTGLLGLALVFFQRKRLGFSTSLL